MSHPDRGHGPCSDCADLDPHAWPQEAIAWLLHHFKPDPLPKE